MSQLVGGKVPPRRPAAGEEATVGHGPRPGVLRPRFVVLWVLDQLRYEPYHAADKGIAQLVHHLRALVAVQHALQHMGDDVDAAVDRLPLRQGGLERGVDDRDLGVDEGAVHGDLGLLLRVGDHGDAVHLAGGRRGRQHAEDGQSLLDLRLALKEVPHVAVVARAGRHSLGRVKDAAPAEGDDCVHRRGLDAGDRLAHLVDARVGLHAADLREGDARLRQSLGELGVGPVFEDCLAAVEQQHALSPHRRELFHQIGDRSLSKEDDRWVPPHEVLHLRHLVYL